MPIIIEHPSGNMAQRIRGLRKKAGLTQEMLAAQCGMSKTYLCEIELGQAENVSANIIYWLSKALDVSMEYLFNGDTEYVKR